MTLGIDFTEEQIENHLRFRRSRIDRMSDEVLELERRLRQEQDEEDFWADMLHYLYRKQVDDPSVTTVSVDDIGGRVVLKH